MISHGEARAPSALAVRLDGHYLSCRELTDERCGRLGSPACGSTAGVPGPITTSLDDEAPTGGGSSLADQVLRVE